MTAHKLEPQPARWYALNEVGEIIMEGNCKEEVVSPNIRYYVQLCDSSSYLGSFLSKQNNHFIFDKHFQKILLEYKGIVCKGVKDGHGLGFRNGFTSFTIADKLGVEKVEFFHRGIEAYRVAFELMKELAKYSSWKELILTAENDSLKQRIKQLEDSKPRLVELEAEIKVLKQQVEKFRTYKSNFRELCHLLLSDDTLG
jgi:hypothetical protein